MMIVNNVFEIGDSVYLLTDKEQDVRLITAITVYKAGELMYKCACGDESSDHYEFELSKEKNVLVAI